MNNQNIKLDELSFEELVLAYENKINEIQEKFNEIKEKTNIVDGNSENWRGKAQESFKQKKDSYVNQFDVVIQELTNQLNLLKYAQQQFVTTENTIGQNVEKSISDVII